MTSIPQPPAAGPTLTQVAHHLSAPRLAPFLAAANHRVKDAVHLYGWNVRLSGTVHELLHGFEVILRNAMDEQLCRWNATQVDPATGAPRSGDWLLDPAPLLGRLTHKDVTRATVHAAKAVQGRPNPQALHEDVLAQLPLGTWRFLLPDNDPGRKLLWTSALKHAFPHLRGPERSLTRQVEGVYRLRNRVAHLEPLLETAAVEHQVRNVSLVLNAISQPAANWVMSQQRVTPVIAQRPDHCGASNPYTASN